MHCSGETWSEELGTRVHFSCIKWVMEGVGLVCPGHRLAL